MTIKLRIRTFRIVLTALLVLLLTGCGSFFFYPQKQLRDNPTARKFNPEDVTFTSSDGIHLTGWFFRARPKALGTVLVLHGNAENMSTHVNSVLWLVKEGYDLLIFDYRGYGRSEGTPGVAGVHRDADAALRTALSMAGGGKVVVLGQSIGGAIAVYTVANFPEKDRIEALVIDSAFSGYRLIAREKLDDFFLTWPFQYPLSFLVGDSYSPIRWIKKVSPVPILIMHGRDDPVVPSHHGHMLFEAALEPKEFWVTPGTGHIRTFADDTIRERFLDYLSRHATSRNPL
jgi:fermentation-respiration switch protein FrsA (DUF1100 family)